MQKDNSENGLIVSKPNRKALGVEFGMPAEVQNFRWGVITQCQMDGSKIGGKESPFYCY